MAKKREMFLVQMSLDVKKAEILKLDARAKDKEEAAASGVSDLMGPPVVSSNRWVCLKMLGIFPMK